MIIIRHRRNLASELRQTSVELGIEMDIRSQGNDLIVHHDAFVIGENFEEWLQSYRHRVLILNVKEEGLEDRVLALMRKFGIEDYFFLDQSFPFMVRTANRGESRCAVRVSEYESVETAMTLAGKVDWVWIDCFTRFALTGAEAARMKSAGFKLCLGSPELHGHSAAEQIPVVRNLLVREGIVLDAVCTKEPELWQ